jgi:hypothetical protein
MKLIGHRFCAALGGGPKSPLNDLPVNRRLFAEAFALMQKIDAEGTAALSKLPAPAPRIDTVIRSPN